ncbi:uncharacterized protein LOC111592523 [Drosophila hydei]|uniref:Uncharacterized protein LOC111592523 n=1 Tax=Drosophila hydei TaxID=7224 RepID=A0A6J1L4C4_DROHY|nr:uncharacterized protein LOC111592523 [Drosophila hydei]
MLILWFVPLVSSCLALNTVGNLLNRLYFPGNQSCLLNCFGNYLCKHHIKKCTSLLKHYDLSGTDEKYEEYRKLLIYGHNGLRNRLATKLNLCDMLEIRWNDRLAMYANRHHTLCHRNIMCDAQNTRYLHMPDSEYAPYEAKNFNISRNGFFYRNTYSANFIPFALSNWYEAHTSLNFPKLIQHKNQTYYKLVGGYNSFFNMINPQTQMMGCSIAMFVDGRSLICYYYPFVHAGPKIYLRVMEKSCRCPYTFPVFDPVFKRICIYK